MLFAERRLKSGSFRPITWCNDFDLEWSLVYEKFTSKTEEVFLHNRPQTPWCDNENMAVCVYYVYAVSNCKFV